MKSYSFQQKPIRQRSDACSGLSAVRGAAAGRYASEWWGAWRLYACAIAMNVGRAKIVLNPERMGPGAYASASLCCFLFLRHTGQQQKMKTPGMKFQSL